VTGGREALVEAMRLEQARIYGQPSTAFKGSSPETSRSAGSDGESKVTDIRLARMRKVVA
jgi:hypothetical protein